MPLTLLAGDRSFVFDVVLAENETLAQPPKSRTVRTCTKIESAFNRVIRKYGISNIQYIDSAFKNEALELVLKNPCLFRAGSVNTAVNVSNIEV